MKKIYAGFFVLFLSANLLAQPTDSTYNFSLKEAIDYALQNQKNVVNAELDAQVAHQKVRETVGIGLPQLSASFDLKDYEKIPTQFFPDFISPSVYGILYDENLIAQKKDASNQLFPVQFGTQWNATAGISASQLLFDPSYLIGVSASKTYRELFRKSLERTKIETAVAVSKAYYNVLLLRERKKVLDANLERIRKLLGDTKAMYDNGFVEKIDVDRLQVALNNVQSENENFLRLMDLSEMMLKFQVGLPQTAALKLTDVLNPEEIKNVSVSTDKPDPSKRIEYSILKTQQQLQQYNVKRYKSQYIPSLVAYGSLNTMAQRDEFNIFESGYRWFPTGIIGATLSLNLFDGFQRESKIRQEKLTLRKVDNELIDFENAVNIDVTSARSNLLHALSALNVQDNNVALATSIATTAKLKYDQGVGSNLEVLDSETSLKEAQVNYFNSLYDAIIARIDLDKALGNLSY
jgi:outer membrane protein TolC